MAGISSTGLGSGLDIRSLVDQLVAAERAPMQGRLDRREFKLQTQLSALGSLKSALSGFRDQVKSLADIKLFGQMKASSSKSDVIGVSASTSAEVGSYQVEVFALAQAQSLASQAFASAGDAVGGGTLTFRFGTVTTDAATGDVTGFSQNADRATKNVAIAAGSTLVQVRDAVNEADIGVQASIINDGSGERLVFSGKDSGAANGFVVDVTDDDGANTDNAGLSRLAFNADASYSDRTRAGQDAQLSINGLSITRAKNEITDAIEGVTLSLSAVTSGSVNIDVSRDKAAVQGKIKSFVDGYNKLQQQITQLTKYDAENKRASVLTGNSLVRQLNSSLRGLLTDPVGVLDGNAVTSLADLGIVSKVDGTLEIDSSKLDKALSDNFDEIGALFASAGLVNDAVDVEYLGSTTKTEAGKYAVNITQLATQGKYVGGALASDPAVTPIVIDGSNDNFTLKLDGIESAQISLTHASYSSGTDLAAELQARINGDSKLQDAGVSLKVSYDATNNRFEIVSDSYGADSKVQILTAESGLTTSLGLAVAEGTAGVNVAGTIDGRTAEADGQELIGTGAAEGLKLRITGSGMGDRGSVTFSRGILSDLEGFLGSYLDSKGVLPGTTDTLEDQLKGIRKDREALARRMESVEARLLAQFTAMDVLVGQLNQTSSYLGQQLASLPKIGK
jgi:flagellar hook-associated protein 2